MQWPLKHQGFLQMKLTSSCIFYCHGAKRQFQRQDPDSIFQRLGRILKIMEGKELTGIRGRLLVIRMSNLVHISTFRIINYCSLLTLILLGKKWGGGVQPCLCFDLPCVQEVVTPFYIVSYYIKLVTTSWTYSRSQSLSKCLIPGQNQIFLI